MSDKSSEDRILISLRRIDPYIFEEFIGKVWEGQGYNTTVRRGSGDRGIDVVATKGAKKELLQVKRYSSANKLGSKEVRRYATLYQQVEDVDEVVIITSGYFTDEARVLARDLDVELISGDKLSNLIREYTPNLTKGLLDGRFPTKSPVTERKQPFDHPTEFSRISDNQGIFDSCPECIRGHIWLGQFKNNRIRLKCERCNSMWKEERKKEGWWIFGREKTVGWIQI